MLRSVVLLAAACCALVLSPPAQAGDDPSLAVTPTIRLFAELHDMGVLVRRHETHVEVTSPKRAVETERRALTVFDARGRDHGQQVVFHDTFRKLKRFRACLLDAEGEEIRCLRRADFGDYPASGRNQYYLYDDNRVRIAELVHDAYPYTVVFETEVEHDGLLGGPGAWRPQPDGMPVEQARLTVRVPNEIPVRHRALRLRADVAEPDLTYENGSVLYRWQAAMLPRVAVEDLDPSGRSRGPRIDVVLDAFEIGGEPGRFDSWASFGSWYARLSAGRDVLPEAALREVEAVVAPATTRRDQARRLYEHLQMSTRYVSVQLGLGGWQPFDAAYVHERGYGDCKALTNYLGAMLRAVGIPAYPALILNDPLADDLDPDFPLNRFNHVVLYVPPETPEEAPIWLEATSSLHPFGQIGAGNEDRWALVVTPEGGRLERTPASTAADNHEARTATVALVPNGTATVDLRLAYTGARRDRVRGTLWDEPPTERTDWLRERLSQGADLDASDFTALDTRSDTLALAAALKLTRFATKVGSRLFVQPAGLMQPLWVPSEAEPRTQPVRFRYPYLVTDDVTIQLPSGYVVEALPDPVVLESEVGRYEARSEVGADGALRFVRHFEVHTARLPAEAYADVRAFFIAAARADAEQVVLKRGS